MKFFLSKLQKVFAIALFLLLTVPALKAVPIDSKLTKGKSSIEYIDNLIMTLKESTPNARVRLQLLQRLKDAHLNGKKIGHGLSQFTKKNSVILERDDFWKFFQGLSEFKKFVDSVDNRIERLSRKAEILKMNILKADKLNREVQTWQIQYAIYSLRIKNLNEATPSLKKEVLFLKERLDRFMGNVFYSISDLELELSQIESKKIDLENELMLFSIENDQDESSISLQLEDRNRKKEIFNKLEGLNLSLAKLKNHWPI